MMGRDIITDRDSTMPTFLLLKDREPRAYVLELKDTWKVIGNLTVTEPPAMIVFMPEIKGKLEKALSFSASRKYQKRGFMIKAL